MDIRKGAAGFLIMAVILVALGGRASAASNTWTLSGTVYDAGTCQGLAGAYVFSPTYSAAINYTVASGNYLIRLGVGNQTIIASLAGYLNTTYKPPYEPAGSIIHYNIPMLKAGEAAANCSNFAQTNTPGTTGNTTTVQQIGQNVSTTTPTSTIPATTSGSSSTYAIVAVVIIIIVILGVIAYAAMRPKKPAPQHHHEQK